MIQDRARVDGFDVADAAEVVLDAVDDDTPPTPAEQSGVLTAQSGRQGAVRVDLGDELRIDLTGEHHAHDADRLGRGDPVAALELARDGETVEHRGYLRAPAVHTPRQAPNAEGRRDRTE